MTTAIALDSASSPAATASGSGSSVALQDQLARCTRQLGDWVACPSGKTPEGEKIIANLRAKIGSIESRLGTDSPANSKPGPVSSQAHLSTLGSLISAYA